jgi:hypothetical protein
MNIWLSQNMRNMLNSWGTIRLTRKALLHAIILLISYSILRKTRLNNNICKSCLFHKSRMVSISTCCNIFLSHKKYLDKKCRKGLLWWRNHVFPLFPLSEGRKTRVSSGRCQQCRAAPWVVLLSLRGHSGRLVEANSRPEQQTAGG